MKPLHVQVAEALGWRWKVSPSGNCRFLCPSTTDNRFSIEPDSYLDADEQALTCADGLRYVPYYDTDWSATGPLIEKYGIRLYVFAGKQGWGAGCAVRKDGAIALPGEQAYDIHTPSVAAGDTPLIAICNLILALKADGKL